TSAPGRGGRKSRQHGSPADPRPAGRTSRPQWGQTSGDHGYLQPSFRNRDHRGAMRSRTAVMVGLLMFGVGCSGGSDDGTRVLGAVVERSGLGAAVPAGIEGIPVPEGVTPAVAEPSGGRVFD